MVHYVRNSSYSFILFLSGTLLALLSFSNLLTCLFKVSFHNSLCKDTI